MKNYPDWFASIDKTLIKKPDGSFVVVMLNFTPVPRTGYRIGVPGPGTYRELLNSDSHHYGGTDLGNGGDVAAEPIAHLGQPWSVALTLPPLAGLVLAPI